MSKQRIDQTRIIQAALAVIDAGTPLTFTNVAKHLQVKSQGLYPYFPNQEALAFACAAEVVNQLSDTVKTAVFGLSGRQALTIFADTCRALGLAHPSLVHFAVGMANPETPNSVLDKAIESLRHLLAALIDQLVSRPTVRLLAGRSLRNIIVGEVLNVSSGWFHDPALSQSASFHWQIEAILDALIAEDKNSQPE